MTNVIIKLVNAATGAEVEREMNATELKAYNLTLKASGLAKEQQAQKEQTRLDAESKLIELGLTVEDLKALLG
jgi:hypothetical protein